MSDVVYFSHSWRREDTPINLAVWSRLAKRCRLLIDAPPLRLGARNPPYYISRIESLLRRSDLFVCCLPSLPREKWSPTHADARGDWRFSKFSPYILFEVRLAERAGLPRLIIYDLESGFIPPAHFPSHSLYLPARFAEFSSGSTKREEVSRLTRSIDGWLKSALGFRHPGVETGGLTAGILDPGESPSKKFIEPIREALREAGIDGIIPISANVSNDAELAGQLRTLDLLVARLEGTRAEILYGLAHAQLVPTIRLFRQGGATAIQDLPFLLRGHPAGYQQDLLPATLTSDVLGEISKRAEATVRSGESINDLESGRRLIQQRTYRSHLVFLSHAAKQDDRMADDYRRELIDAILTACAVLGIDVWEYDSRNIAGKNWKLDMEGALKEMTHFVPLITDNYLGPVRGARRKAWRGSRAEIVRAWTAKNTAMPEIVRL